ncbi:MAG: CdvA-like protein [Candidatus Bathyarchaeota archaeon]|nr:MAG: CdvA-like protein [Candidatus Bathyarchaeota archaeon]
MEKINGELELARRKKEALGKLFNDGKVSQLTFDSFSNEIAEAIAEIEAKQSTLVEKMRTKISGLEQQIKTLEHLLVNSEIRHISGELEEEAYNREWNVLSLGLEATKQELDEIKEAVSNISGHGLEPPQPPPMQVEEATEVEPATEERTEVIMDTETSTSIETTSEESILEDEPEMSVEEVKVEEESVEASAVTEEEPFQSEESTFSEESEATDSPEDVQETLVEEPENLQETLVEEPEAIQETLVETPQEVQAEAEPIQEASIEEETTEVQE